MNEKETYNNRLLIFADHLSHIAYHRSHELIEEVEVVALEVNFRVAYTVKYRHWIFDELPNVFESWCYHEATGNSLHEGDDPEEGTIASVIDFFGLTLEEFGHLFDIEECQLTDEFGGEKLSLENSLTGTVIAGNIVEFVKKRRTLLS
jgi:hypothetical protein